MILTNYHTHYSICDGKGEARDFLETALAKGFRALGFSSHAPLPYENKWTMKKESLNTYLAEIRGLKAEYSGKIEVYLGIEADYIENIQGPSGPFFTGLGLDYIIGAMHIMRNPEDGRCRDIDAAEETYRAILEEDFDGDIRAFAGAYYRLVGEMARSHRPKIIAHFDLIKKNNPGDLYFKETDHWYQKLVKDLLPVIKTSGAIVEINTGGLARKRTTTTYPSPWIIRLFRREGIPIMLNSDAHRPENLDAYFPEALEAIRGAGYREIMMLLSGKWVAVALDEVGKTVHETL